MAGGDPIHHRVRGPFSDHPWSIRASKLLARSKQLHQIYKIPQAGTEILKARYRSSLSQGWQLGLERGESSTAVTLFACPLAPRKMFTTRSCLNPSPLSEHYIPHEIQRLCPGSAGSGSLLRRSPPTPCLSLILAFYAPSVESFPFQSVRFGAFAKFQCSFVDRELLLTSFLIPPWTLGHTSRGWHTLAL